MRVPLQPHLYIHTEQNSKAASDYIYNGIVEDNDRGEYTTQRPAVTQDTDASGTLTGAIGRGAYYWANASNWYFAANDSVSAATKIYRGPGYSTACTGAAIASGSDKIYFEEIGNYLCIIDPEGNKGYYIDSAANTVIVEITDTDFPPKQTPALSLARGAVALNGRLYVMDTDGTIWNSALEDPSAWAGGDNINAEVNVDEGVMLAKHENQIVAFGSRTTEFFYHAQNPTNSPLSPRLDTFHEIGAASLDSFYQSGGRLFFIGKNREGTISVYMMEGMGITQISRHSLDAVLTKEVFTGVLDIYASGVTVQGRTYYIITIQNDATTGTGSYVYDAVRQRWYVWGVNLTDHDEFNLVDISQAKGTADSKLLFRNGDQLSITTQNTYQDFIGGATDLKTTIYTRWDGGTQKRKFVSQIGIDAFIQDGKTGVVSILAEDEGSSSQFTIGTINLDSTGYRLPRGGSFVNRRWQITFPGASTNESAEIRALEFDVETEV